MTAPWLTLVNIGSVPRLKVMAKDSLWQLLKTNVLNKVSEVLRF